MQLSIPDKSFMDSFESIGTFPLDEYEKNELNVFMLRINANEFDYRLLVENLLEPIITYSVSRDVQKRYSNKPHTLTKKATARFVEYCRNTGELGELLLYAFLECHLNAPKILTKLELKTSTSMYVHGADGVHYLQLPNGNYQLIFGEAKMIQDLGDAIRAAFKSIAEFKNEVNGDGVPKSGISYEKGLISDNLLKESFSEDDIAFLRALIYPRRESSFRVDDAFGIFVGYDMKISDADKFKPNDEFRKLIRDAIYKAVEAKIGLIRKCIIEKKLIGHSFHIYILPFTDMDDTRKKVLEELVK